MNWLKEFFENHWYAIITILILCLGIVSCTEGVIMSQDQFKKISVPGTVYGKNEGVRGHYKSSRITSEFYVAVHPDDSKRYKDYDIKTTFACYAGLKPGDHVTFDVYQGEVDRNYKEPNIWVCLILEILGGILIVLGFVAPFAYDECIYY